MFLVLLCCLSLSRLTTIARLKNTRSLQALGDFARAGGSSLVDLNPYTGRGMYYEMPGFTGPVSNPGENDLEDFIIERIPAFESHDAEPADPLYPNQDYLQFMRIQDAWAGYGKGSPDQVIVIVDSGKFFNSSDMKNFWRNPSDLAPGNGLDEDGNGYPDDFNGGWDVVGRNNLPYEQGVYHSAQNYYFSHGSFVWTAIAAQENDYGVVGGCPRCKVIMVKAGYIQDNSVLFDAASLVRAMDYIVSLLNMGVDIRVHIASYGGYTFSEILQSATKEALGPQTLFFASAGNYNRDNDAFPMYPCSFNIANKICVGAVEIPNGEKSPYSNYGNSIDISAPGTVIGPVRRPDGQEIFAYGKGTSFSNPLAAAIPMIIWANDPSLSAARVKTCILSTARSTGHSLATKTNGVVNAYAAAALCLGSTQVVPPSPSPSGETSSILVTYSVMAILLS